MKNEILKLINKPLADNEHLSKERLKYLEIELENLTDEYLNAFKTMLETNRIDEFKHLFSEKDFKQMKIIFNGKIIKENFSYMSFILDSFYNFS